jgi:hypothetical protein
MATRSRARLLAAALGVVALVVVAAGVAYALNSGKHPAQTQPAAITAPTPKTTLNPRHAPKLPVHGVYLGAYVQGTGYSQPEQIAAIRHLQHQLGRRLQIVHSYLRDGRFPTNSQLFAIHQGSDLLVSWTGYDTRQVIAGKYDKIIRERARAMKATHGRIFLEWRWEMNRGAMQSIVHSPRDYIRAWDHVRAIFRRQKVNNVAWVWCPSSKGWGDVPGYEPGPEFYPGNNEVDWLCADVYPRQGSYVSFESSVRPFLSWASHIDKPVMIGEFGAPRSYQPQQRVQWLNAMAKTVAGDRQIKALIYFDGSPPGHPAYLQYGLDPGSPPLKAFRGIAHQRYFELTAHKRGPPA